MLTYPRSCCSQRQSNCNVQQLLPLLLWLPLLRRLLQYQKLWSVLGRLLGVLLVGVLHVVRLPLGILHGISDARLRRHAKVGRHGPAPAHLRWLLFRMVLVLIVPSQGYLTCRGRCSLGTSPRVRRGRTGLGHFKSRFRLTWTSPLTETLSLRSVWIKPQRTRMKQVFITTQLSSRSYRSS